MRNVVYGQAHVLQLTHGLDLGGAFGRGDNADIDAMRNVWPILREAVFKLQATHNRANKMAATSLAQNRSLAIRGGHDPDPRPKMPWAWWQFESTIEFNREMWNDIPAQVAAMGLDMAQIFEATGNEMYGGFKP